MECCRLPGNDFIQEDYKLVENNAIIKHWYDDMVINYENPNKGPTYMYIPMYILDVNAS